jgi:hypothetical protein
MSRLQCASCERRFISDHFGMCVFCGGEPEPAAPLAVLATVAPGRTGSRWPRRLLIGGGGLLVLGGGLAVPVQGLQQHPSQLNVVAAAPLNAAAARFAQFHAQTLEQQPRQRADRAKVRRRKAARRKPAAKRSRQRRWVTDPAGDGPRADRDIRRVRLTRTPTGFSATFILAGKPAGPASYFIDLYRPGGKVRLEALRKPSGYVDLDSYDASRQPAFITDSRASHRTRGRKVKLFWPERLAGRRWNGRWSAHITSQAGGDSTRPVKYVKRRR